MKLTSELAIISIKHDRAKLAKHFNIPSNPTIPVTITGFITGVWGRDDGIDQEFTIKVTSLVQNQHQSASDLVWSELGSVLASLDHSQISPAARTAIREALERATGTKAP